ncbi:hypothetical protein HK100_008445 [Physocladia obscura]|uniref:Rhodanese domain-containing protein n=1 Tax=Physocladia obscura TaxID=109957 RepID=A0AAD5T481_9FUNG|nr:hypothetical protein HK100_008445 [Physocladia obscura]
MAETNGDKNWWDDFPTPASTHSLERWPRDKVAALMHESTLKNGADFLVVANATTDVRRTDFGGGTVKGAINVHAQTFYLQLDEFVAKYSTIPIIFFFCNSSSLSEFKIGRGPRCAGWYQDALDAKNIKTSRAVILAAGIKGWINQYKNDTELTQDFDEEWWKIDHN